MSYLAGKIVMAVTAGRPNNGRSEPVTAVVQKTRIRGRDYPYVSAQPFRRWLRETMAGPTGKAGIDDDLLGRQGNEGETTPQDPSFMVGTFIAVEPVKSTTDFGVMPRGIAEPVPHAHEFYTADLAAPFLLDLPRVGTFPEGIAEALNAGAVTTTFRGRPVLRLPLEVRRERVAALLEALAELAGGTKRAPHYGDRTPALIAVIPMAEGVNPLGSVIDGAEDGSGLRVRPDALRAELQTWRGGWEAPIRVGWRPGFRDGLREEFQAGIKDLIENGQVVIDHPGPLLRDLAADLRSGLHNSWFT